MTCHSSSRAISSGKATILPGGLCHPCHVAQQQNGHKLEMNMMVRPQGKAIDPPTHSQCGSHTPGPYSPIGWITGEVVPWEGRQVLGLPSWNLGFSFQSTSCAKNLQSSRMQYTIRVARKQCKGGGSTTCLHLRNSALLDPASAGHHRLGAAEVEKNLHSVKSTVEKKLFFQKHLSSWLKWNLGCWWKFLKA